MRQAQFPPLGHYEFDVFQHQAGVEVQPVGLEGFAEALALEEQVGLLVLPVLLWALLEVCALFEQLVLLVPVEEQAEFFVSFELFPFMQSFQHP